LHLQEFTLVVHEMDYSVEQLHEDLGKVLHRQDALLIGDRHRGSSAHIWQDSEWSKGDFTLIRLAWDPGIEGFIHYRIVQRSGTIQWHIWDPGEVCSDSGGPQSERVFVQALLEDKRCLVHWKNLRDDDATWEGEHILEHPTLRLLEGKQHLGGQDCHVPSQTH